MMYISVDIEADGPIPGDFSMLSLGAVVIEPTLDRTFYREFRPISENYNQGALDSIGWTREHSLTFPEAKSGIWMFHEWLSRLKREDGRLTFVSDNPIFDGMFVSWYLHHFYGSNPFGFSGFALTSFSKGWERDMSKNHKRHRRTKHTHNALDDARGNAEAFLYYTERGLKNWS